MKRGIILMTQKGKFMNLTRKIGFWPVFALVTGSQIGSGVFMLPANLAPYGKLSLLGWVISGFGAILLALVFAQLCARIPKTGGPHNYVQAAFGKKAAFVTGWTYWIISWVSSTAVVIASIGYLTPLIGIHSSFTTLILQIGLLFFITALNLRGVKAAGNAEFFLTVIKFIPLIVVPFVAFFYFNSKNITSAPTIENVNANINTWQLISHVTLLTLWGFIGLESATTPAGSVKNPSKTIPRAIVLGTLSVALIYAFNSLAIMGVVPNAQLMQSQAPYSDASRIIFGGNWNLLIALLASIVCIGTLNAWMLTSGQIALGLAQDGLMPAFFARKNKFGAPYYGLMISALGMVPFLVLTLSNNLAQQINTIIDISVTTFLFVYLICILAFLKILKKQHSATRFQWIYGLAAFVFCAWIIITSHF